MGWDRRLADARACSATGLRALAGREGRRVGGTVGRRQVDGERRCEAREADSRRKQKIKGERKGEANGLSH